jgi:hypothetical protein
MSASFSPPSSQLPGVSGRAGARAHDLDLVQQQLPGPAFDNSGKSAGVPQHIHDAANTRPDVLVVIVVAAADLDNRDRDVPRERDRRCRGRIHRTRLVEQRREERTREPLVVQDVAIVDPRESPAGVDVDEAVDLVDETGSDRMSLLFAQPAVRCAGKEPVHVEHVDGRVPRDRFHRKRIGHGHEPERAGELRRIDRAPQLADDQKPLDLVAVHHGGHADSRPRPRASDREDRNRERAAAREGADRNGEAIPAGRWTLGIRCHGARRVTVWSRTEHDRSTAHRCTSESSAAARTALGSTIRWLPAS